MKMYVQPDSKIFTMIETLLLTALYKKIRYRYKFIKNLILLFMS